MVTAASASTRHCRRAGLVTMREDEDDGIDEAAMRLLSVPSGRALLKSGAGVPGEEVRLVGLVTPPCVSGTRGQTRSVPRRAVPARRARVHVLQRLQRYRRGREMWDRHGS